MIDNKVGAYLGEVSSPSGICTFCCKVYAKLSVHLNTCHQDEERIKDIRCGPKHLIDAGMEMLLRDGNHKNNLKVLATGTGVFIPSRRSMFARSIDSMTICGFCNVGLENSHLNRHLRTCTLALDTPENCETIDKEMKTLLSYVSITLYLLAAKKLLLYISDWMRNLEQAWRSIWTIESSSP